MFTYLDPNVRKKLVASGKLRRIDGMGREIDIDAEQAGGGLALNLLGPIPLPLGRGGMDIKADWYAAVRRTELARVEELAETLTRKGSQALFADLVSSMAVNSVLVVGQPQAAERPLVRVHSSCLTGDVFGSLRCECGPQLEAALARLAAEPHGGLLIYMAGHEGRGIGLWAKAATYLLQDGGESTYEANRSLGLPDDCRDFSDAAALLHHFLGGKPLRLLTNNPKKIADLQAAGIADIRQEKHVAGVSEFNRRYLHAKRDWGHDIDESDLG